MLTLLGDANKNSSSMLTSSVTTISVVSSVPQEQSEMDSGGPASSKPQDSDILRDLDQKLSHLDPDQRNELKRLIHEYEQLFPDIPSRTDKIYHDEDVEDTLLVKQHLYRMNHTTQKYLREEIQHLLGNDFIEPS